MAFSTWLGALIGAEIDASDGEGGAAGAIAGAATAVVLKRLIPLAIAGAGVLVAKHYWDKAFAPETAD
jgi:hypothetical protein